MFAAHIKVTFKCAARLFLVTLCSPPVPSLPNCSFIMCSYRQLNRNQTQTSIPTLNRQRNGTVTYALVWQKIVVNVIDHKRLIINVHICSTYIDISGLIFILPVVHIENGRMWGFMIGTSVITIYTSI